MVATVSAEPRASGSHSSRNTRRFRPASKAANGRLDVACSKRANSIGLLRRRLRSMSKEPRRAVTPRLPKSSNEPTSKFTSRCAVDQSTTDHKNG